MGWRKMYHANTNQNKAGVAILVLDKTDIRTTKIVKDKEGYYIMIMGSILQEDLAILNMYAPDNKESKYVRQKLLELKGELDKFTFIIGDFNTP